MHKHITYYYYSSYIPQRHFVLLTYSHYTEKNKWKARLSGAVSLLWQQIPMWAPCTADWPKKLLPSLLYRRGFARETFERPLRFSVRITFWTKVAKKITSRTWTDTRVQRLNREDLSTWIQARIIVSSPAETDYMLSWLRCLQHTLCAIRFLIITLNQCVRVVNI